MGIRILLIHSFCLYREGLKHLLEGEAGFEVIGDSPWLAEALSLVDQRRPDVILIEANLPGSSSADAAQEILRIDPATRILFLSAVSDPEILLDCMQAGAAGFLPRETTSRELAAAVRLVSAGETYLPPAALSRFVDGWRVRSGNETHRSAVLTAREREILKLLAEGHPVKACAAALNVSPKTVEAHKFNLMRKLNIHNKAQLVHYAFQKKIVVLPLAS